MRRVLLLLLFLLAACPPSEPPPPEGTISVGPKGGTFEQDGVVLVIPANALEQETTITVSIVDVGIPEVPQRRRISQGYRLSPTTLVFKEQIQLTVPFLEERIPTRGIDPSTFDMRRNFGDDPYTQLPGSDVNAPEKVVTGKTDRLGLFWITSPLSPNSASLTLDPVEIGLRVGMSQQFTATVTDPGGAVLPDVEVRWSLVAPRIATVDSTGRVTALAPGVATLTARSGTAQASAKVYVVGSAVGPETFVHDNPFPTGNDLRGGSIALGHAFFVGSNGTVLARSPSGDWTRYYSAPGVDLLAIAGSPTGAAVAVGVSGTAGVLVELKAGTTTPTVKVFTDVNPSSLWFDGTYGMAAGSGNDVLVLRGGTWTNEQSPSVEKILAVAGNGQGGFTTLGDRGSMYQYKPSTLAWDSLYQTQLSVHLQAGALVDATGAQAWAVGGNKLWHFTAGSWTPIPLSASPSLTDLTALALVDGKIVLGGQAGRKGYLLTYDPQAVVPADAGQPDAGVPDPGWTVVTVRAPQNILGAFASGQQAYAVGTLGAIWEYQGGTFAELSRGYYGDMSDVAVAGGDVFAAMNECIDPACTGKTGAVLTRTGLGSWAPLGSPQPFVTPVWAVAARSPNDVYAAGTGVYHFDGAAWSLVPMSGDIGTPLRDLALCGSNLWAVGLGGAVYRGDSSLLVFEPGVGPDDLYSVFCPDDKTVWLAGRAVMYENKVAKESATANQGSWRGIWSPGYGEAFAVGEDRYAGYWDTVDLNVMDGPGGILPDVLGGIWGSSVDNLYAVGYSVTPVSFGYAVRYNGTQWSLVDAASQRALTCIHGSSATEIWLGGKGGGLLRALPP